MATTRMAKHPPQDILDHEPTLTNGEVWTTPTLSFSPEPPTASAFVPTATDDPGQIPWWVSTSSTQTSSKTSSPSSRATQPGQEPSPGSPPCGGCGFSGAFAAVVSIAICLGLICLALMARHWSDRRTIKKLKAEVAQLRGRGEGERDEPEDQGESRAAATSEWVQQGLTNLPGRLKQGIASTLQKAAHGLGSDDPGPQIRQGRQRDEYEDIRLDELPQYAPKYRGEEFHHPGPKREPSPRGFPNVGVGSPKNLNPFSDPEPQRHSLTTTLRNLDTLYTPGTPDYTRNYKERPLEPAASSSQYRRDSDEVKRNDELLARFASVTKPDVRFPFLTGEDSPQGESRERAQRGPNLRYEFPDSLQPSEIGSAVSTQDHFPAREIRDERPNISRQRYEFPDSLQPSEIGSAVSTQDHLPALEIRDERPDILRQTEGRNAVSPGATSGAGLDRRDQHPYGTDDHYIPSEVYASRDAIRGILAGNGSTSHLQPSPLHVQKHSLRPEPGSFPSFSRPSAERYRGDDAGFLPASTYSPPTRQPHQKQRERSFSNEELQAPRRRPETRSSLPSMQPHTDAFDTPPNLSSQYTGASHSETYQKRPGARETRISTRSADTEAENTEAMNRRLQTFLRRPSFEEPLQEDREPLQLPRMVSPGRTYSDDIRSINRILDEHLTFVQSNDDMTGGGDDRTEDMRD